MREAAEDTVLDYRLGIAFDLSNPHVAYAPCPICEPHAGEVHEMGYPPPPPLHPNCMCTIAGLVEEESKEIRCPQCNKLLGKGINGGSIECPRCSMNVEIERRNQYARTAT